MCQTLAQGGKRCDTHKDGSKATVSLTSRIADVQEKIVRKVFGALKKEGKGLENPDREEVVSYAETGKFLTKYNPDIPERQKKTIMNQFDKAKEEAPSGPLFHAWKHTLPETLRRTRKTMSAIGVAGVIMATSACGGTTGTAIDHGTASPSSSPSISQSATPSATPKPVNSNGPGTVINGMPTKAELANDGKGEYVQTSISPDDPAFTYNPSIVDPSASGTYSPEDITAAQKVAVTFLAEEGIDSTLNNNPSDVSNQEAWWAKNKDRFAPTHQDEIHNAILANDPNQPFVFRGQYRAGKYDLASGPSTTHVLSRTITPVAIKAGNIKGESLLGVQSKVDFTLNAVSDGAPAKETVSGTVSYTLLKDSSGKWLITGSSANYNITPVK